ncbi:MAG: tRNA lysidine(34) synthetase TilS [Victivallales bacterium]|jgi:tRNA(Ile)-lysidine synthase|nr:tRNA lysidine(34) synthetase TilS [Victivallales bacterium]
MNLENCAKLFNSYANGTLYVGFSGGADSTAALLLTLHFQPRFAFRVIAIHFDHNLRGEESQREAENAEKFAREHNIEFHCIKLNLAPGANLEERSRNARLSAWKELVAAHPDTAVVLGHHAGDRAENLFLRLARGANVSALTSMRSCSTVENVTFLRPLLAFTRSEIEDFLHTNGVHSWAKDSSNSDNRFARNMLRNKLLPEFFALSPGGETGLARSLSALESDAEFIESEVDNRFREIAGQSATPLEFWQKQPPALLIRLLRRFVARESGYDYIPNREILMRLADYWSVSSPNARKIPLDANRSLLLQGNLLALDRVELNFAQVVWNWRDEPEIAWGNSRFSAQIIPSPVTVSLNEALFDANLLDSPLTIDRRHDGDRIIPFGEKTEKSLKKLRIDRGVAANAVLPVLRGRSGIVWAPGIRHGAAFAITPKTNSIVKLKYILDRK